MNTALIVVTVTTALVTAAIAVADLIPAGFVLANSAEVGVPRSWLPAFGGGEAGRGRRAGCRTAGPAGLRNCRRRRPGPVLCWCGGHAPSGPCSVQHRVSRRLLVSVGRVG